MAVPSTKAVKQFYFFLSQKFRFEKKIRKFDFPKLQLVKEIGKKQQ